MMRTRFQPVTLGTPIRSREYSRFRVTKCAHAPDLVLPPHAHQNAAITIVTRGDFRESMAGREFDCGGRRDTVLYKPGGQVHSNRFGPSGLESLLVEFTDGDRDLAGRDFALPCSATTLAGPALLRLAMEIHHEFIAGDTAASIALEGAVLELVAVLLRCQDPSGSSRPPAWLKQARDLMDAKFNDRPSLSTIASTVGIHPLHLARVFRRHLHCSVGHYLRSRSLQFAAAALRDTDRPIGEIALDAGFYDQSHFSRAFKRETGVSPLLYRSALRSR
jgi:AraC family transcriptional regulator